MTADVTPEVHPEEDMMIEIEEQDAVIQETVDSGETLAIDIPEEINVDIQETDTAEAHLKTGVADIETTADLTDLQEEIKKMKKFILISRKKTKTGLARMARVGMGSSG